MNGLTLLGLIGMAWVAVSVLLGVGIGRCCYDTNEPERAATLSDSSALAADLVGAERET